MTMTDVFRHGDVLILTNKDFKIPKEAKLKAGKLIHKGTNNSHVISKGSAAIGEHKGKKYLRVKSQSIVSHVGGSATHASKPLPKGDYWVEIQTFYDHLAEEAKQVVD
jgi:hypothetical protein